MNGPHDVGGLMGFGPVHPEADEPVFHRPWEGRVLGLTLSAGALGHWNLDQSRHGRECLAPAIYYSSTYYEIWLSALEQMLTDAGLVSEEEVRAGRSLRQAPKPARILTADRVPQTLRRGGPVDREPNTQPRFNPGDPVRAKIMNPRGHTRLPRYVRGRRGRIESVVGFHVFPDSHAHDRGEAPQWLYTVAFSGDELWGSDSEPNTTVTVDAWEPYLEPC